MCCSFWLLTEFMTMLLRFFSMRSLIWKSVEDILQILIVFAVESLELDFALLFPERHILLRVLPVLVVLATLSEKDSESLYKRVKINRLINIFKVLWLCWCWLSGWVLKHLICLCLLFIVDKEFGMVLSNFFMGYLNN